METIVPASDSIPSRRLAMAASRLAQGRKKLVRLAETLAIAPSLGTSRSSGRVVLSFLKILPICNISGNRIQLSSLFFPGRAWPGAAKRPFDTDFRQIYHPRPVGQRIHI